MVRPSQAYPARRTVTRLDRERQRLGITQAEIAEEATKTARRGTVGITTVSKVLGYHTKSQNVLDATRRMIDRRLANLHPADTIPVGAA